MADYQSNALDLYNMERSLTGTTRPCNEGFAQNGYLKVENLWDPEELYYPVPRERGMIMYDKKGGINGHNTEDKQVPGSLSRYGHPQYRKIHIGVRKKIEDIIGRKLYNTYYYDRYYFNGQQLKKHADRPACEISVTVHISTNLPDNEKDWPIWFKTPDTYVDEQKTGVLVPGEERSVICQPGDGVIYKGCERPHWRNSMPFPKQRKRDILLRSPQKEYYYHQIFFHYVLQDGIRAHFAYDNGSSGS